MNELFAKIKTLSDKDLLAKEKQYLIVLFATLVLDAVAAVVIYILVPEYVWIILAFLPGMFFFYFLWNAHKKEIENRGLNQIKL